MKKHYRHEDDCLNCGTILEGKYCHNCGQENLQIKESFGHMVNHAVSDYFHFDHQFFHTLNPLLVKPGKLTNEYMAGRRMQYLHPVKMYIFISLVFFFLYLKDNKHQPVRFDDNKKTEKSQKNVSDSIKKAIDKNIQNDKNLSPQKKAAIANSIKKFIPDSIKATHVRTSVSDTTKYKEDDDDDEGMSMFGFNTDDKKTYKDYLAEQSKLPADERDNFLERYFKKKSYDWKSNGKGAKDLFAEAFKHNVPKMMFILLPLFALILKIAFWKNRKFYVEHLIYTVHLHCFMFLFLTLMLILGFIMPDSWSEVKDWVQIFGFFYICWYVYKSLRVVYNRSRGRTISKMFGISFMYLMALSMCFLIIAAITALTTV